MSGYGDAVILHQVLFGGELQQAGACPLEKRQIGCSVLEPYVQKLASLSGEPPGLSHFLNERN